MSETYTYHLGIYSKLVRGADPEGPIKVGAEARVNGQSAGFPNDLIELCQPRTFFRDEPMVTEIDPRRTPGGVFAYRPVFLNGRHLGLFARIEARSEEGAVRAGRRYTHCAVLFVEDKWEPSLLPWAAEMLFTNLHGGRCWGNPVTERDDQRTELPVPVLDRQILTNVGAMDRLLDLGRDEDGNFKVRGRLPDITDVEFPYVAMASDIAEFLDDEDYLIHGRWLTLALGVGAAVEGHGRGYFFRYDLRPEDAPAALPVTLAFSDNAPPLIAGDFSAEAGFPSGGLVDWASIAPPGSRGMIRRHLFTAQNLWPDQKCPSVRPEVARSPVLRRTSDELRSMGVDFSALSGGPPTRPDVVRRFGDASTTTPSPPPSHADPETEVRFPVSRYLNTRNAAEPDQFSMDDLFDPEVLAAIKPAFRNLCHRILLLDPPAGYRQFHPTPDDPKIVAAFEGLALALIGRASVGDLVEVRPWLLAQIYHPALPVLGLTTPLDRSGILQTMLTIVINGVGFDTILTWVDRQRRLEMNLKIQKARMGLIDQGYQVYVPNERAIRDFFDWLGGLPYSPAQGGAYDEVAARNCMNAINGIIASVTKKLKSRLSPPV